MYHNLSALALIQEQIKHRWVVFYDDAKPIHKIYSNQRKKVYGIGYSAREVYEGSEVIIFSDDLVVPKVKNPLKIAA